MPNSFSFHWDSGAPELVLTNSPVSGYQNYSFMVQATSASTDLHFTFTQPAAFWDFDDVSTIPRAGVPRSRCVRRQPGGTRTRRRIA